MHPQPSANTNCFPGLRPLRPGIATRRSAAWIAITAVVVATCAHDVGDGVASRVARPVPVPASAALVGIDPGFAPTQPLRELAVAGATFARSGGADLNVAFVGFVTGAAANDGDGRGSPLDRTVPAPADANGADDVFVAAVVNTERVIAGQPVPTAFTQGLAPVFRDQRCIRCHSFHYPNGWRVNGHVGSLPAKTNAGCVDCHKNTDILVAGQAPSSVSWIAPDVDQTVNPTQDFRGKTDRQLFDLVMTRSDPKAHLQTDDRILWAIGHGRVPFRGTSVGGRVPMDPRQWQNLVEAWAQAGMPFSSTAAIQDIVLASRRSTAAASGNGASSEPSIAFVPNPGYQPSAPTAAALGTVHVAFASSATNLTAVAATARNVYRSTFEAWLLADGTVDLRYVAGQTVLVSRSSTGGNNANGDSGAPAIDGTGNLIAFQSLATNLISGFVADTPPRSNVYLRSMGNGAMILQSHSLVANLRSGNGDSIAPAISASGGVVAFESSADDLVAADGNGVRDVFFANQVGAQSVVSRASVHDGGAEAKGGASSHASVFLEPTSSDLWIAFESTSDLGNGVPSVFLHHATTVETLGMAVGTAEQHSPELAPGGDRLVFLSAAPLDGVRTDLNGLQDVVELDMDALRNAGIRRFQRTTVSVTGADADGASTGLTVGGVVLSDGTFSPDGLVAFTTAATNLGRSPNSDAVVAFAVDRSVPRVVAEFTSPVTRGVAPFAMSFQDLSNNATTWSWDFGDGGTSTEQNPSHVYAAPGTYTVQLTVGGTVGAASTTKTAFAQVTATPLTWAAIYSTYQLSSACAGCHNLGQTSVRYSMTTATIAYDNMVNIDSTLGCMPTKRVLPGNAAQSGLMFAVGDPSQCVSFRMGSLSPQALQDLVDWIEHGVPR